MTTDDGWKGYFSLILFPYFVLFDSSILQKSINKLPSLIHLRKGKYLAFLITVVDYSCKHKIKPFERFFFCVTKNFFKVKKINSQFPKGYILLCNEMIDFPYWTLTSLFMSKKLSSKTLTFIFGSADKCGFLTPNLYYEIFLAAECP